MRFFSAWRSPANIAIIKYWGKHGEQLPDNPSLSVTLSAAVTETQITTRPRQPDEAWFSFRFQGQKQPAFAARIAVYLERVAADLQHLHLSIESQNTFPHSSGIASSASAMSALALCLADIQSQGETLEHKNGFLHDVSSMARLGSGSACRSVYGPVAIWGRTDLVPGSSDEYAIPFEETHPVFDDIHDSILIIDDDSKPVPSSSGHILMKGHPFANARAVQATEHLDALLKALHTGDFHAFGAIAEAEAMTLHALMMTSDPWCMLLKPQTLDIVDLTRKFREATNCPVFFTLDAGPNVHLLYPSKVRETVQEWIARDLLHYCKDGQVIHDHAGKGPERIGMEPRA